MSDPEISAAGVALSNTDKVMFPDNGVTKGDLIDYYRRIAPAMLPYLAGRPITMHRFPEGIGPRWLLPEERKRLLP